jgi:hypothetical protein
MMLAKSCSPVGARSAMEIFSSVHDRLFHEIEASGDELPGAWAGPVLAGVGRQPFGRVERRDRR